MGLLHQGASRRRRRVRTAFVAGVALTAILPFGKSPASATTALTRECVESNTFTFSPPLGMATVPGNFTWSYTRTCVLTVVNTSPLGESVQVITDSGGGNGTYFGSCAIVLLNGATVNTILGGTLHLASDGTGAKAMPLVPNRPCTDPAGESSATGTGSVIQTT